MRLTAFTDYGLRMLMRLAALPSQAVTTAELAKELGLPRNHLNKIMQRLAQGGVVTTRRGNGGGASLSRAPGDIQLGDVVRLLEKGQPLVECFDHARNNCSLTADCRLKSRLRAAELAFLAELGRSTLADIALAPATV